MKKKKKGLTDFEMVIGYSSFARVLTRKDTVSEVLLLLLALSWEEEEGEEEEGEDIEERAAQTRGEEEKTCWEKETKQDRARARARDGGQAGRRTPPVVHHIAALGVGGDLH